MVLVKFRSRGPNEVGKNVITHKSRSVCTTLHSNEYETFLKDLDEKPFKLIKITSGEEARPDVIAYNYYGSSEYYWLVMQTNNISDPYEGLLAGDVIKIIDFITYL
tara:strand:- start:15854 stop:16171 length:318 start_codon:yes stop_codon:yes gene_type:complete